MQQQSIFHEQWQNAQVRAYALYFYERRIIWAGGQDERMGECSEISCLVLHACSSCDWYFWRAHVDFAYELVSWLCAVPALWQTIVRQVTRVCDCRTMNERTHWMSSINSLRHFEICFSVTAALSRTVSVFVIRSCLINSQGYVLVTSCILTSVFERQNEEQMH